MPLADWFAARISPSADVFACCWASHPVDLLCFWAIASGGRIMKIKFLRIKHPTYPTVSAQCSKSPLLLMQPATHERKPSGEQMWIQWIPLHQPNYPRSALKAVKRFRIFFKTSMPRMRWNNIPYVRICLKQETRKNPHLANSRDAFSNYNQIPPELLQSPEIEVLWTTSRQRCSLHS